MQHGHKHAAWTRTCSMDKDMGLHHGHGHTAWTRHAAWTLTRTCSIDMEIPTWSWTCSMGKDMQYGHGHAAWTWTSSTDLVRRHGLVHAAWIWTTDMHGCGNADKKLNPASLVFR